MRRGSGRQNSQYLFSDFNAADGHIRSYLQTNSDIILKGLQIKIKNVETKNMSLRCLAGSVQVLDKCVKCGTGLFFDLHSRTCVSCPVGYFEDEEGRLECKKCPQNYSTFSDRSQQLSDCRRICSAGTYGTKLNLEHVALSPCRRCPMGHFQPLEGQQHCETCTGSPLSSQTTNCPQNHKCTSSTCKNNGTCFDEPTLICLCTEGFLGAFCEKAFNPCDSSPCINGGSCLNMSRSTFTCTCMEGFQGPHCEFEINGCLSHPCQNEGSCYSKLNGFYCDCPLGLLGDTCSNTTDTCSLIQPCLNDGTCTNLNAGQFHCTCLAPFSGRFCDRTALCLPEEEWFCEKQRGEENCTNANCLSGDKCQSPYLSPKCIRTKSKDPVVDLDVVLNFPKCSATDYMMIDFDFPPFSNLSACLWVQTADGLNFGTLLSYATGTHDNAFTLTDYNGLVFYVLGQRVVTDVIANDGLWHFICSSWETFGGQWKIYLDGKLAASGKHLAEGFTIDGRGKLVVGQEQDYLGGGFNEVESFVGKLSKVEMWTQVLNQPIIDELTTLCDEKSYNGSLDTWTYLLQNLKGNIQRQPSNFCKSCGPPLHIFRAEVSEVRNVSRYQCQQGFLMKFANDPSQPLVSTWHRKCLKTGEWESNPPICTRISCGPPGALLHGAVIGRSHLFEDTLRYHCHSNYKLVGPNRRTCQANGQWSGEKPFCEGATRCDPLSAPRRGSLFMLSTRSENLTSANVGDQFEITCDVGYHLQGAATLTCMPHGGWDHQVPNCTLCPFPRGFSGLTWSSTSSPDQIYLQCIQSGETITADCVLGTWNIPPNFCVESKEVCYPPRPPRHGFLLTSTKLISNKFVGDPVFFGCRYGYQMMGPNVILCSDDRTWNTSDASCQPVNCSTPLPVPNAQQLDGKSIYKYGDVVRFHCLRGFHHTGVPSMRCEADGKWSKPFAQCTKIRCGKPVYELKFPINGKSSYPSDDVLQILCINGTEQNITCQLDGSWTAPNCNQEDV